MKLPIFSLLFLFCLVTTPAQAAPMYLNLTAAQLEIETDVDSAKPFVSAVKLGYQFAQGLALEAQIGSNIKDDKFGDGKLQVDNLSAIFLRLGGQNSYNDVKLYLLVGRTKTEVKYKDGLMEGKETFEGNAFGIGAEEYSKSIENMAYVLEYIRYNSNSDETITGIALGLRYDF